MDWFTADLHFGHKNIMKYTKRPWASIEEMDEAIIAVWNACIARDDNAYVLGDFSFYPPEQSARIFHRLNGKKHLVLGNHDKSSRQPARLPWTSINQLLMYRNGTQRIVLCHYPLLTWESAHHGTWHLHGHCHGNLKDAGTTTRMDVGIDTAHPSYQPYSYDEVARIMSSRKYDYVDHHDPAN
jgi:calcineurin-like phosphoesterase family protein